MILIPNFTKFLISTTYFVRKKIFMLLVNIFLNIIYGYTHLCYFSYIYNQVCDPQESVLRFHHGPIHEV